MGLIQHDQEALNMVGAEWLHPPTFLNSSGGIVLIASDATLDCIQVPGMYLQIPV